RVDALVEGGNAGHVEGDVGKVAVAAAQKRDDALDRDLDIDGWAKLTRLGVKLEQPLARIDLAGFRELHAHDPVLAPRDAAAANSGVENGVPTPRHTPAPPRRIITPP